MFTVSGDEFGLALKQTHLLTGYAFVGAEAGVDALAKIARAA